MESQKNIIGKPFKPGNPGKPKGATNKINRQVKEYTAEVFDYLQTNPSSRKKRADLKSWAEDNPKDFYNIASKLINVQVEHSGSVENPIILKLDERFNDTGIST